MSIRFRSAKNSALEPGPHQPRKAINPKIGLHVSCENHVGSKIRLFLRGQRARVMKPWDVIHHEYARALGPKASGLREITFPIDVITVVFRQRLQKEAVFAEIRSSEWIVAVRA